MKRNASTLHNPLLRQKRDLQILRNIIIRLSIYLDGGLPTIIADSTPSKIPYLLSLVTQVFAVFIVNICTSILGREIRQVIKNILCHRTTVIPFNNIQPLGNLPQNL